MIKNIDRYFGSDLNKFIHYNCKGDMTVNNIDLIMSDYNYTKNKRIIESKHLNEKLSKSQKILLPELQYEFNSNNIKIKIYVVYGNEPYNKLIVCDVNNEPIKELKDQEVIDWLNFKFEIN